MESCIRHLDRAAVVAHYRRPEETPWRELELLPGRELRPHYEMALRGA